MASAMARLNTSSRPNCGFSVFRLLMVVHSLLSLRVIESLNRKKPVKLPAASVLPAMLGHMTPNIHRPSTRNHRLLAGRF